MDPLLFTPMALVAPAPCGVGCVETHRADLGGDLVASVLVREVDSQVARTDSRYALQLAGPAGTWEQDLGLAGLLCGVDHAVPTSIQVARFETVDALAGGAREILVRTDQHTRGDRRDGGEHERWRRDFWLCTSDGGVRCAHLAWWTTSFPTPPPDVTVRPGSLSWHAAGLPDDPGALRYTLP